jgi:hypothetical protein
MEGQAEFKIEDWKEAPFSEVEQGGKLTRASVRKSYTGEIEGEGVLEYLMSYKPDGSAEFVGLERVSGRIGDHPGSFVLQHSGKFENGAMTQKSVVVAGSGTATLADLRGECSLSAGHQQAYPFVFEYEFE